MKLLIIANPQSGTKQSIKELNKWLPYFQSNNIETEVVYTEYHKHAIEIVSTYDFSNIDAVIGVGGDGTFHEIVNGMMQKNNKIPLGMIPCGSGNSYIRDLDLLNTKIAIDAIIKGKTKDIDVIEAVCNNEKLYAANIIGWGLVTDIGMSAEKFRWLGTSRYTIMSIVEVLRFKRRKATLILDGKDVIDDFTFIMACNTIHTGKGMKIAPNAKIDDGLMDIIVVKGNVSKLKLLQTLPKIFTGAHIYDPNVHSYQAKDFSLIPQKKEGLNIDGELLGSTPINATVIKHALKIFCSNTY